VPQPTTSGKINCLVTGEYNCVEMTIYSKNLSEDSWHLMYNIPSDG
jgi:hypothetical protein